MRQAWHTFVIVINFIIVNWSILNWLFGICKYFIAHISWGNVEWFLTLSWNCYSYLFLLLALHFREDMWTLKLVVPWRTHWSLLKAKVLGNKWLGKKAIKPIVKRLSFCFPNRSLSIHFCLYCMFNKAGWSCLLRQLAKHFKWSKLSFRFTNFVMKGPKF